MTRTTFRAHRRATEMRAAIAVAPMHRARLLRALAATMRRR